MSSILCYSPVTNSQNNIPQNTTEIKKPAAKQDDTSTLVRKNAASNLKSAGNSTSDSQTVQDQKDVTRPRANSTPTIARQNTSNNLTQTDQTRKRSNSDIVIPTSVKNDVLDMNQVIDKYCKENNYNCSVQDRQTLIDYVQKKQLSNASRNVLLRDLILTKHLLDMYITDRKLIERFNEKIPAGQIIKNHAREARIESIIKLFSLLVYDFFYAARDVKCPDNQMKKNGDLLGRTQLMRLAHQTPLSDRAKNVEAELSTLNKISNDKRKAATAYLQSYSDAVQIDLDNLLKIWLMQSIPNLLPELQRTLDGASDITAVQLLNSIINEAIVSGTYTALPLSHRKPVSKAHAEHKFDFLRAKFLLCYDISASTADINLDVL